MARELTGTGVTIVALYPGPVRTDNVLANAAYFDFTNSESPQFIGRAIAALASDPTTSRHNGKALVAAELAPEYAFTDLDGHRPASLRHAVLKDG